MSNTIDAVLLEWSYRSEKGYPDVTNPADLDLLKSVLREKFQLNETVITSFVNRLIREAASSGEDFEAAIVSNWNGEKYKKDAELDYLGKETVKQLKSKIKGGSAIQVGRSAATLTDFWKSVGASDNTPKTDIIIKNYQMSVKLGPAQLMSGGRAESYATFLAAAKESGLDKKVTKQISDMLNGFAPSTKISGNTEDYLQKDVRSVKTKVEKELVQYVQSVNMFHKQAMETLNYEFSQNPDFKREFAKEAASGVYKFGAKSTATAQYILAASKDGNIKLKAIDNSVAQALADAMKLSVRFKSSSVKKGGTKTGEYRIWSVVGLITPEIHKIKTLNEELDSFGDVITEAMMDKFSDIWNKIKTAFGQIFLKVKEWVENSIAYISGGINQLLQWLDSIFECQLDNNMSIIDII